MAEYDMVSFSLCLISLLALGICLLAIFLSYRRFKLRPILYYFFAFAFFLLGILGIIPSTLILDASQDQFITLAQAYTFGLTFIGIFFLLLAISCAKGSLLTRKTMIMSFLVGGTLLGYVNPAFYSLTFNDGTKMWDAEYHPAFLGFISFAMLIIIVELVSYVRLMRAIGTDKSKSFENLYFLGWLVLATGSGGSFMVSRVNPQVPANLYLLFFSLGLLIISIVLFVSPASLIASPLKVFNITFADPGSGLPYLSYDFRRAEVHFDPEIFSGVVTGMAIALKDAVKGKRYLKRIDGVDRKILLERGLQTQAILTVEDETELFRRMLRRLLILFEMEFYLTLDQTNQTGIVTKVYQSFAPIIEKFFAFAI